MQALSQLSYGPIRTRCENRQTGFREQPCGSFVGSGRAFPSGARRNLLDHSSPCKCLNDTFLSHRGQRAPGEKISMKSAVFVVVDFEAQTIVLVFVLFEERVLLVVAQLFVDFDILDIGNIVIA